MGKYYMYKVCKIRELLRIILSYIIRSSFQYVNKNSAYIFFSEQLKQTNKNIIA